MSKVTALRETEVEPAAEPSRASRNIRFYLLVAIPALVVAGAVLVYLLGGRSVTTDNAYVKADKIPISSQVSGNVTEVLVKENDHVQQGQILYRIDDQPIRVNLAKAQARLAQVRTDLSALKASYFEKQAEIALAQKRFAFALKDKNRLENLSHSNLISDSQFDSADQSAEVAQQQIEVLKQDLKRIEATLGGSVESDVEQHPSYLSALAELQQVQLDLHRSEVRASANGIINAPPKVGQYLQAGQTAMALVTNQQLWVEANFTETDLTYVHPGQDVTIHIDTYPGEIWHGKVESLSPATLSEFSLLPAQNATGNWVKIAQRVPVRIALAESHGGPTLRAGLSSEVKINTQHQRSLFGITL
ncbi:putative multidrug resistance protein EmrK [Thalassocella blandensis]|nr:putative multidrug resistance protein EmrK [Thalassocella blandensis]